MKKCNGRRTCSERNLYMQIDRILTDKEVSEYVMHYILTDFLVSEYVMHYSKKGKTSLWMRIC